MWGWCGDAGTHLGSLLKVHSHSMTTRCNLCKPTVQATSLLSFKRGRVCSQAGASSWLPGPESSFTKCKQLFGFPRLYNFPLRLQGGQGLVPNGSQHHANQHSLFGSLETMLGQFSVANAAHHRISQKTIPSPPKCLFKQPPVSCVVANNMSIPHSSTFCKPLLLDSRLFGPFPADFAPSR